MGGFGTCTDENGEYTLEGLPLGTYTVEAGHEFCGVGGYMIKALPDVEITEEFRYAGGIDFHLELAPEPSPQYLNVQPDHGWADSGGWTVGSQVTISFDGYSATLPAVSSGDPDYGSVWFDLSGTGIALGMDVHITDGIDYKDLYIVNATFDYADEIENTAGGTGPAGAWIGVGIVDEINGYENPYWVDGIQIDGNGDWFVDFDDSGQDFGAVTDAWLHVFDEDGDSTIAPLDLSP